jgi:chromosome segregation ATPase
MLKIITKSAHNALLYQMEDLKKKLESANENIESYKEDLDDFEKAIKAHNEGMVDAKIQFNKLNVDLSNTKRKYDLCATRHKSCVLRNEKLQKANTSLLSKNESLTAENHRLGNLLQVKCDEVKTLEKEVKDVEKAEQLNTDAIAYIEKNILDAVSSHYTSKSKALIQKSIRTIVQEALKIKQ